MSEIESSLRSALSITHPAQQALLKHNERLENARSISDRNGIPRITITPAQGALLSILCKSINAKNVLEIGTLGGYSTIWFAESVPAIKVTSIEFNPKHRDVALQNVAGLDVDIILGAALDVLPRLSEGGKVFDFVFIDADWTEQSQYFDWAVKMTRKGGLIYVDNVVRQLTEREADDHSSHALIDHVKTDQRVEATLIPTLSTEKVAADELVDGFLLAYVK